MAGGTFKASQEKVRPGTYHNFKNGRQRRANGTTRGVAVIPLIGYDWGPRDEWITITAGSPDAASDKFGRSVYDDNPSMLLLQLILMGAEIVHVYIPDGGEKATTTVEIEGGSATVTAKYKGTFGNKIQIVSVDNPVSGYDISVYVDGNEAELFEKVEKLEDLAGVSAYVDISGDGTLKAFASASLSGGTDDTQGNKGITTFLDKSEKLRFNTMCFPSEDVSLRTALLTKIKYIRENIGWKCQAVAPNFKADYEGIINLVNGFVYNDIKLTALQASAWLAGATAGAEYTESLTYATVVGATGVTGEFSNEEAIEAINSGETFFSMNEEEEVILEYDINSLTSVSEETPADAYKNRPLRVYDTWCNDLLTTFIPGRYDNDSDGWDVVEGIGKSMLKAYAEDGAITNVDLEADFLVDREKSIGDSMYITAGLQAVDSADKYYITTIAR